MMTTEIIKFEIPIEVEFLKETSPAHVFIKHEVIAKRNDKIIAGVRFSTPHGMSQAQVINMQSKALKDLLNEVHDFYEECLDIGEQNLLMENINAI